MSKVNNTKINILTSKKSWFYAIVEVESSTLSVICEPECIFMYTLINYCNVKIILKTKCWYICTRERYKFHSFTWQNLPIHYLHYFMVVFSSYNSISLHVFSTHFEWPFRACKTSPVYRRPSISFCSKTSTLPKKYNTHRRLQLK